uniref:N-alpha-acetyltransferase 60 n=1 Tax=Panagrellus redivivus TaxID=6233 RepID=A0A7E4V8J1_PANRE
MAMGPPMNMPLDLDVIAERFLIDIDKDNVDIAKNLITRILNIQYSNAFYNNLIHCSRDNQNKILRIEGIDLGVLTTKLEGINEIDVEVGWDTAPAICRGLCLLHPVAPENVKVPKRPRNILVDIVLPKGQHDPGTSHLPARVRRKIGVTIEEERFADDVDANGTRALLIALSENALTFRPLDWPMRPTTFKKPWCFSFTCSGGYGDGPSTERVLYVSCLGLLPMAREMGLGSLLLRNVMKCAYTFPNCRYVCLHVQTSNIAALRFYKRHGFKIVRRVNDYYPRLSVTSAFLLAWSPWEYCRCDSVDTKQAQAC